MAQKLERQQARPLTHDEQEVEDERESNRVFLGTVRNLAECDEDLSTEETEILLQSSQNAEKQMDVGDESDIDTIGNELRTISDKVDNIVDVYNGYFERMLASEDSEVMLNTFLQVGGQVFRDKITPQRIIVLLVFSYKLVKLYMRKIKQRAKHLIQKDISNFLIQTGQFLVKAFLKYSVLQWIRMNGGWSSLVPTSWSHYVVILGTVVVVSFLIARYWKS